MQLARLNTNNGAALPGVLLTIAMLGLCAPTQTAAAKDGHLLVPQLLDSEARRRHPGFVAPHVWVYDEVGTALPSKKELGAYATGEKIALPPGWYQVEVGNVQADKNRVKLRVVAGKITVVPTGLVVVNVETAAEQPRDRCHRWSGQLFVSLPLDPKPGPVVATNREVGHHPVGIVQVVAGYYRIQWNRFYVATEIKENQAYRVQTGLVEPMAKASDYQLHLGKGISRANPGLRLCQKRSTRVLARTYWGTWNRQISSYPFKQRDWEQITVEGPPDKKGPYQKLGKPKIRGRIHKGPGADPVRLWEIPAAPEPKAPKIAP